MDLSSQFRFPDEEWVGHKKAKIKVKRVSNKAMENGDGKINRIPLIYFSMRDISRF